MIDDSFFAGLCSVLRRMGSAGNYDVEHTMQTVFDAPRRASGGERFDRQEGWGQPVRSGDRRLSVALDVRLDHAERGESEKARFSGKAAVCREPSDIVGVDCP